MPSPDIEQILGTAPDPRAAAVTAEARALHRAVAAVALPSSTLPGWQALCAAEYAQAVHAVQRSIGRALGALSVVADP